MAETASHYSDQPGGGQPHLADDGQYAPAIDSAAPPTTKADLLARVPSEIVCRMEDLRRHYENPDGSTFWHQDDVEDCFGLAMVEVRQTEQPPTGDPNLEPRTFLASNGP